MMLLYLDGLSVIYFMIFNYIYYDTCVKLHVVDLPLHFHCFHARFLRNPKTLSSLFQFSRHHFRQTYFVSSSTIIFFIDPLKKMGGRKTSSVAISSGSNSNLPKRERDQAMKMWVANTTETPNRKFKRCRNVGIRQFLFLVFVLFWSNFVCNFCFFFGRVLKVVTYLSMMMKLGMIRFTIGVKIKRSKQVEIIML